MDSIGVLVGHPNLAAVGPEGGGTTAGPSIAWVPVGRKKGRDCVTVTGPVNPKDGALLARDDHVKPKCPNMVERNPVVVGCEAPGSGANSETGPWRDLDRQKRLLWRKHRAG